jgi:hypothetical protein
MRIQVAAEAARVLRAASDSVADRAALGDREWWLVSAAEGDTRDEGGLITRQKRLLRWGAAIVAAQTLTGTAGAYTLEREHAGANYKIVVPDANWNETLVVLAHGYRDKADHPGEVDDGRAMDLDFEAIANGLAAQGYAVAATSYWDNGWAVKESIHDITALRAFFKGGSRPPGDRAPRRPLARLIRHCDDGRARRRARRRLSARLRRSRRRAARLGHGRRGDARLRPHLRYACVVGGLRRTRTTTSISRPRYSPSCSARSSRLRITGSGSSSA